MPSAASRRRARNALRAGDFARQHLAEAEPMPTGSMHDAWTEALARPSAIQRRQPIGFRDVRPYSR